MRLGWLMLCAAFSCLGEEALRREGSHWVSQLTGEIPAQGIEKLKIVTTGAVIVQGDNGSTVRYTITKRARVRSEADARVLVRRVVLTSRKTGRQSSLGVSGSRGSTLAADLQLFLPRSMRQVSVHTIDGMVEVYDVQGTLEAESGAGSIRLDRIGGETVARTGGGEIRLGHMESSVRALSAGGSITAEHVGRESWFETAGGEISIGESGGPIHASTAGGNIRVARAGGAVSAHASGGRIDVQRAAGIVTAGNSSGSINVGEAHGARCESSGGSIRLRGTSGELRAVMDIGSILAELVPGVALRDSILSTGSGDITVFIPSNLAVTVRAQNDSGRPGRIVSEFREIPVKLARVSSSAAAFAEGSLNGGGPVLRISVASGTIYLRRQR